MVFIASGDFACSTGLLRAVELLIAQDKASGDFAHSVGVSSTASMVEAGWLIHAQDKQGIWRLIEGVLLPEIGLFIAQNEAIQRLCKLTGLGDD